MGKIGIFAGSVAAFQPITWTSGTPAASGTAYRLPDYTDWTAKKNKVQIDFMGAAGYRTGTVGMLVGVDWDTKFNQRDKVSAELDETLNNMQGVLMVQGAKLVNGKKQWLFIYGQPVINDGAVNSKDGISDFKVLGIYNDYPIVMGAGGVAYPTGLSASPTTASATIGAGAGKYLLEE